MRYCLLLAAALLIPACSRDPQVQDAPGDFNIIAPVAGAIGVSGSPTFSWQPSIGATSYQVQVSTDNTFATTVVDQVGLTATTISPAVVLAPGTVFFWRVIATRPKDIVFASGAPFTFTTFADTPAAFALLSPANLSTGVSSTPTFTWEASLGAVSYTLEVASDVGFTNLVLSRIGIGTTSSTVTVPLTGSSLFFWRVTAVSTNNVVATGAPWTFTTAAGTTSFSLTLPANGATAITTTPTYTWTAAAGASSYTLQVSTGTAFTSLVINQTGLLTTTSTPATTLLTSTTYFWRVLAVTGGGTLLPTITPFVFTTGP